MNLGLEGRVCVVTGGTRGIGAATARMLSQEGARVLRVARHGGDIELDVTAADAMTELLRTVDILHLINQASDVTARAKRESAPATGACNFRGRHRETG